MRSWNRRSLLGAGSALAIAGRAAAQADLPEQRLLQRGIILPPMPAPVANFVPHTRAGSLLFIAGTAGRSPDGTSLRGKVGGDIPAEAAYQHARLAGLGLLATMRDAAGSLDKVVRILRVEGRINAVPEFTEFPRVLNGCSDLLVEVFGERGRHARTVFGAATPFGVTVYVDAVVELA